MSTEVFTPTHLKVRETVHCFLVWGSSLFIGFVGNIVQWDQPGEVSRVLKGHHHARVFCLLKCRDMLWSGSDDSTLRLWNVQTGECVQKINTGFCLQNLCLWKEHVIGGGFHKLGGSIGVWSPDGTSIDQWEIEN